jgi:hypothetical protein
MEKLKLAKIDDLGYPRFRKHPFIDGNFPETIQRAWGTPIENS